MRPLVLLLAALAVGCAKKPAVEPTATPTANAETTPAATSTPTGPTEAPKPTKEGVDKRIEKAVAALTNPAPEAATEAAKILQTVLDEDPRNAYAWLDMGVAKQRLGNIDEARRCYETASTLDPSLGKSWLYLGAIYEQQGSVAQASEAYRRGVQLAADDIDLRVGLIGVLRKTGQTQEAIGAAQAALKLNSTSVPVYNELGLAYMDSGQYDLAKFVYQKAINSLGGAENNAYVRANLGWLYYLTDEKGPALFHLQAAVRLDENLVPALVYLSHVYMDDRNYGDVVPMLERAWKQAPKNHGVVMNLALAYRGVGRYEDSKRLYEEALKIVPRNPDPYFNLGVLYGDYLKLYPEAIDSFQKYVQAGGAESALATEYITAVDKEKKKAEKKKAAAEKAAVDKVAADKKKAEDAARKAEEEKKAKEQPTPEPETPQPEPQPEGGSPSPWGGGGQ